jgi:type II secretory pathway component GspD/PulD (secretin)
VPPGAEANPATVAPEGQTAEGGTQVRESKDIVPLDVQVVIARYQGEKRVSSVPYTLAVNTNSGSIQLNMGAQVPVPSTTFTPAGSDSKTTQPLTSFNYRQIGTVIDCSARIASDGRFELSIMVEDSAVIADDGRARSNPGEIALVRDVPVFRNFRTRNTLLLRDGQTRQYTAATDRVTGETVRIDVTLRVVK